MDSARTRPGEHAWVMQRLYEHIALAKGSSVWADLPVEARDLIKQYAAVMCARWAGDPALRAAYEPGSNRLVDLIALQHDVAEAMALEERARAARHLISA